MKNSVQKSVAIFDVVIVYEGEIARAASDSEYTGKTPFALGTKYYSYNETYEYFLDQCRIEGLTAAFATTHDISANGKFSAVWVYDKKWERLHQPSDASIIFDKFSNLESYNEKYKKLLYANTTGVEVFHNQRIREVFDNKLKTYQSFTTSAIPTVKIDVRTEQGISNAKKKLVKLSQSHKNFRDFTDEFILKDQFGSGGNHVYKVSKNQLIQRIGMRDTSISYILQPLIEATGFQLKGHTGNMDLRIIVCRGQVFQCYIRIPQEGEFKANASTGSAVEYILLSEIPKDVLAMAQHIRSALPVHNGYYALDFIKSEHGNLYFIEGNITPGLIWFNDIDEMHAKELMCSIIQQLQYLVSNKTE